MNTYEVSMVNGYDKQNIVAETASKARYKYFQINEFEESYSEMFRNIRSRKKGEFKVSDLYGDEEQFAYVIKYRGIEFAKIGMRCEVNGNKGIITGTSSGCNLAVCYEGNTYSYNSHPYWKFKYFNEDGELIAVDGKLLGGNNEA